jgi:general secretion pathway protein G
MKMLRKKLELRICSAQQPNGRLKPNGFTLVELMVVIFILGLLTTIVVINVLPSQDRAMVEKARADVSTIGQALEMYRLDNLWYPSSADGLKALITPPPSLPTTSRYRKGGYIKKLPQDPWGRPYQFDNPGRRGPGYDLYSLGADGVPGGEEDSADIYAE